MNAGIRELIVRGRINATSIMVASPYFDSDEAAALDTLNSGQKRADLGLHVTLTAPFGPMSAEFSPLRKGHFLPLNDVLRGAVARRLQSEPLITEIATQLRAFIDVFGRPPDFVDGHQHAQLFPQVRDAFLRAVKEAAPDAWVRQGGRLKPLAKLIGAPKALVLDVLSAQFRKRAAAAQIPFNPAFAGAYDFSKASDFGVLMGEFLQQLPEGGLVMCHPGFVDETLSSLDPLTTQREAEHAFLASDRFPALLAANKVTLG